MSNTNFLNQLQNILQDPNFQLQVANACSKAYAEGVGHPEWHSDFGGEDQQMIAQNLAGPLAVNTGISVIALLREEEHKKVLEDIANGNVSEDEKNILLRLANLSWAAQQPFRGRADRVNVFDLLSQEEVEKDYVQITTAAKMMYEALASA